MTTRLILILCTLAAAGCAGSRHAAVKIAPRIDALTPLEEHRRTLTALKEQQQHGESLKAQLVKACAELADANERLAQEQHLRQEAELALHAAKLQLETSPTSPQIVESLRTALEQSKTELAAAREEIKARREELLKLIVEQQNWNKYVLDKIRTRSRLQ
ncbi:MAG TPA: hypothetical protein VM141_01630 [Planctomycetota bacterium]|nr:hypothetical protein [Planctomycetota bacterium]